jgi:AcrR family transcriptional regulator
VPRPPRPDAHDALLDAARVEFSRRGVDRARVEDVARRAGISKGAFYLHFRTKEDAFREILQRFLGALHDHAVRRQEVEDRIAREEACGGVSLARRIDAECAIDTELLELLWRNRQILGAVDGAGGRPCGALVADFRRRMRALVSRRILLRQATGQLRGDVDPGVVADLVVGAHEGLARRMSDLEEKPDLAAWARALLVVLYEGIGGRPTREVRPARRARAGRASP